MTETLFTLGRSIIDRITSPILREMPIAQVASTIQQARISWGERFDPRIQRKYQKYAQHMAETLNKGKFLQTDSYYRALEPADHHIAFNLLAQPVPNEERIPEFIKTWQYKPIEGYFLG
ncbi:hypothetical protein HYT02_05425, partial [Candidatus Gottesmanbacteria bacterium]|nr:hypothetical protein [Candidatus Gottesmanbacteria bacterium]